MIGAEWTEEQEAEFIRIVNHHMQTTYSSALHYYSRADEISDEIDHGFRQAVRDALRVMGVRP